MGYRLCPTAEDTLLGTLALGLFFSGRTASLHEATEVLRAAYA